jgi:hypothetical protein
VHHKLSLLFGSKNTHLSLFLSSYYFIAFKRRRQKEEHEEKADLELLDSQNREWEEAEAAADEYDYQQILRAIEVDSQRMVAMNTQSTSTTSTQHPTMDHFTLKEYRPMEENEATLLREKERLDRQVKKMKAQIKKLQQLKHYAPYGYLLPRSSVHQRRSGKTLTDEERRAVLHCFEMCEQEGIQRIVSTAAPVQRTAHYLGMATKTVQSALIGIKARDKRGQYIRTLRSEVFEPYIRNLVKQWNLEGTPVTIKKLHKSLREFWGSTHQIPTLETIRQHLHRMGLKFDRADKARNYIETHDIRIKRRHYLRERYSAKYKGALFVWLDESYVHHHHVHNKVSTCIILKEQ